MILFTQELPPWWLIDVFVPVVVGLLGSLVGLLAGFQLLRWTEAYRRIARWEPYADVLWKSRIELYGDIARLTGEISTLAGVATRQTVPREVRLERWPKMTASMQDITGRLNILGSKAVCDEYAALLVVFVKMAEPMYEGNLNNQGYMDFQRAQFALFNAMRGDIHAESLSDKLATELMTPLAEATK